MLSLSRIQLQVLSIYPVEFELVPEVRRIVAIFTNELKMYVCLKALPLLWFVTRLYRKGIKVDLRFGDSIQKLRVRRIRSDKSRLAQVLTNLLSNAIKFAVGIAIFMSNRKFWSWSRIQVGMHAKFKLMLRCLSSLREKAHAYPLQMTKFPKTQLLHYIFM